VVAIILSVVVVAYVVPTLALRSNEVTVTGYNITFFFEGKSSRMSAAWSWSGGNPNPIQGPTASQGFAELAINNLGSNNCTLVGVAVFAPFSLENISGPSPYYGIPAAANASYGQGGLSTILYLTVALPSNAGTYVMPVTVDAACG